MSLTCLGTGKEGGLEYSTSLPGSILQSLCPLGDQHSWRTHHLRPWLLLQPQGPDMQVAEQRTDFMVGQPWKKEELTDSSEPTLPQLSVPLHVNSWVQCFNTPIFCLELWRKLKHQWHICLLSFCSGQWCLGNKWRQHSWSWNKYPYAPREGRASGNEMQMNATVGYWNIQTRTQVVSWLRQERWLPCEALAVCHQYCVTPSTVQWSQVRWGSATLFRQNPISFFKETIQDQQFHLHFKRLPFI